MYSVVIPRRVEFRAGEQIAARSHPSSRDKHLAVGQERRGMEIASPWPCCPW